MKLFMTTLKNTKTKNISVNTSEHNNILDCYNYWNNYLKTNKNDKDYKNTKVLSIYDISK